MRDKKEEDTLIAKAVEMFEQRKEYGLKSRRHDTFEQHNNDDSEWVLPMSKRCIWISSHTYRPTYLTSASVVVYSHILVAVCRRQKANGTMIRYVALDWERDNSVVKPAKRTYSIQRIEVYVLHCQPVYERQKWLDEVRVSLTWMDSQVDECNRVKFGVHTCRSSVVRGSTNDGRVALSVCSLFSSLASSFLLSSRAS